MSSASNRAERYRELARQYHRLAAIGSSSEIRDHYLRMTEHYNALAEAEEQGQLTHPNRN
jgi:hypothetical protein